MSTPPIVPFWNRLRDISLYPFRGGALASLLLFGLALALLGWLPIVGGLLWLAACRYAFEVLLATANGRLEPPEVLQSSATALTVRYVALQVLTILIPVAVALIVEPALGLALFIALLLVQPAAIIGLALTGSLGRALEPALWLAIVARIGWPYLALIGLLFVIQFSAVNADDLLQRVLPSALANAVSVLVSLWALFATFHLMGYLVYQYHQEFGFEPAALSQARPTLHDADRELLELAGQRIQNGEVEAARQLLRGEIRSRAVGLEGLELYRRLLLQGPPGDELLQHSRLMIHRLLLDKQEKRALEIAGECVASFPGFVALEPEQNARLAERARFSGQSRLAIDLLSAALADPQPHADKPRWALLAAELLSRFDDRVSEARKLLVQEIGRCGDPEWRRRLELQLGALGGG
jgi:hypothetical protein